jgi:hypothetical protein
MMVTTVRHTELVRHILVSRQKHRSRWRITSIVGRFSGWLIMAGTKALELDVSEIRKLASAGVKTVTGRFMPGAIIVPKPKFSIDNRVDARCCAMH